MATVFGSDASKTKITIPDSSLSWNIDGVVRNDEYSNVLLYSFGFTDQEAIDVRRAFNDITHIFAFGRDIRTSLLQVHLLVLMGKVCPEDKKASVKDLCEKYEENRIYKRPDNPINITIGDWTEKGYLVEMSVGNVNPTTNTCVITLSFLIDKDT